MQRLNICGLRFTVTSFALPWADATRSELDGVGARLSWHVPQKRDRARPADGSLISKSARPSAQHHGEMPFSDEPALSYCGQCQMGYTAT